MLIIWLQGIWLPQHGYSFSRTPLWAGIYMIPLTVGFILAGPLSGILSDRYGARFFATVGLIVSGASFLLLETLPMNFNYVWFALMTLMFAIGMGLFFSPNQAGVMNSLPPDRRGVGAGMLNTFQNSAQVLSMGLFFTIVTLGLASSLPTHLYSGLVANGVNPAAAHQVANQPPIGSLFSAFLGYNPIQQLLGPSGALAQLPAHQAAYVTGRSFFPSLIEQPFANGLHLAFDFAAGATLIAVVASALRGRRYIHRTEPLPGRGGRGRPGSGDALGPGRGCRRCPALRAGRLLAIGAAAAQAGVSERALSYYQQLGLITPSGVTPGGMRRYSDDDLARVARIPGAAKPSRAQPGRDRVRPAQRGSNGRDPAGVPRPAHRAGRAKEAAAGVPGAAAGLRVTVETKRSELNRFLQDLDGRIHPHRGPAGRAVGHNGGMEQ